SGFRRGQRDDRRTELEHALGGRIGAHVGPREQQRGRVLAFAEGAGELPRERGALDVLRQERGARARGRRGEARLFFLWRAVLAGRAGGQQERNAWEKKPHRPPNAAGARAVPLLPEVEPA